MFEIKNPSETEGSEWAVDEFLNIYKCLDSVLQCGVICYTDTSFYSIQKELTRLWITQT